MDNFDFKKFYEGQHDYAAFRNDPARLEEYKIAVTWKVRNLCGLVPPSLKFSSVTEVGCAMGIVLNSVADNLNIQRRTGIDIASENIKTASEFFPAADFFNGTLEDYIKARGGTENGKLTDLLILSDIVEHIPDDNEFLRTASRITDYLLFNLPLEKCFRNRNRKYGTEDPSGHLRNYNKDDADYLVTASGFEIIKSCTINAHTDKDHFRIFSKNRAERVSKKPIPKRIFWSVYYKLELLLLKLSPSLYSNIYGTNYFALLKSVR